MFGAIVMPLKKKKSAPVELDLVSEREARAIIGGASKPLGRTTFYRAIQAGMYPKAIRVSANCARWLRHELVDAIRKLIDKRAK